MKISDLPLQAPPLYRRPLRHSPFFERAAAWLETDRFIEWSGYLTPDAYSATEQEYFAIRNAASLFDLTPMIKLRIRGPDAERFLNRLVTRDVRTQQPGRVTYAVWCDDEGQVIDDGTIFRFAADDFRLCTGEPQLDWLLDAAIGHAVTITDETHAVAALALQGPTSASVLRKLGIAAVETLKPMRFVPVDAGGLPLMLSRTGFTGDLGYELWTAPDHAPALWDRLIDAGRTRGLRPIGYAALEMARIEAGHVLPDVDFLSAAKTIRPGRSCTPYELGLDAIVAMDKGHFNGRRALQALPVRRRLVGIETDAMHAPAEARLYADRRGRRPVGQVTSALWSPTCKRSIGLAWIEAPACHRTDLPLWADFDLQRELRWERIVTPARIVPRPFYASERRHATPPADR